MPPAPPLSPRAVRAIIDAGDPAAYPRLVGTPGFCMAPMAWPDAVAAVRDGSVGALGRMGRDPEGVRVYWRWKDEMDATYASTADYVKIHILGFGEAVGADGRKVATTPPPNADDNIVWRLNDFPYNYAPGIRHYNVWCTRPLTDAQLAAVVDAHAPAAAHDAVAFVNPAALASIPSVWHAHVLVKEREGGGDSLKRMHEAR